MESTLNGEGEMSASTAGSRCACRGGHPVVAGQRGGAVEVLPVLGGDGQCGTTTGGQAHDGVLAVAHTEAVGIERADEAPGDDAAPLL